jgi:hypothetical protein
MAKLKDNLEFILLIGATSVGAVIYLHDTFASTKRVESLEHQIENVQNVVCAIAIEQKVSDVKEICRRRIE